MENPANSGQDRISMLAQQVFLGKKVQHTFSVDHTSSEGKKYEGQFTIHRPTIGEKIRIGTLDARFREELSVDTYTGNLCHMLATLIVVIDNSPAWWDYQQLFDYEMLEKVYLEYVRWVNQFFRFGRNGDEKNSDESVSTNNVDNNDSGRIGVE